MIVATGSIDYLEMKLVDEENFKQMVIRGDTDGWLDGFDWTNEHEERLQLLRELIKYKKLYLKVEKELEELNGN